MISSGVTDARVKSFRTIQLLRFIAAFMVVFTHATFYVSERVNDSLSIWSVGTQGVPIFFVISGFVMALTSRSLFDRVDGGRYFILSRLLRIVPLYWMLNFFKILVVVLVPGMALANPDVINIILSMFFVFSRNADGLVETFYGVGWTLNFEMFFYCIFAIAIILRLKNILFIGGVLVVTALLSLVRDDSWPAFTYVFSPIIMCFLWGIIIERTIFLNSRVSVYISSLMVVVGVIIIFLLPHTELLGLQYALLVGGFVFLEDKVGSLLPKFIIFGGDASYSLYLVHPMVGVFVAVLLSKLGVSNIGLSLIIIICASFIFAALTYKYFELPVTRYLRRNLILV